MKQVRTWLATVATLLCSLTASAHDFEVDGIYYKIPSSTGLTVEVTYRGDSSDSYSNEYSGTVTIPTAVTYDSKTYRVTSIKGSAFSGCSSITSLTIPESVTSIGEGAFSGSTGELTINCNIPSVSDYKKSPFYNSKFSKVTIGAKVKSIGSGAFSGCDSLTTIVVAQGNNVYDSRNGCNAIIATKNNTLIQGCSTTIIPTNVKSIGASAFYECSSLTSITIPESVKSIGSGAFSGCDSLTTIVVAQGNNVYDSRNGCNAIIETKSNTLIQGCSTTIIPENVKSIGNSAFSGYGSLTSITIPESVTSIGNSAFSDCSSLVSVTIPKSVRSIGEGAFSGSTGELIINCNVPSVSDYKKAPFYNSRFSKITIGDKVTIIGNYAFSGCGSLTSITISESVDSIGSSAFSGSIGELTINCNIPSVSDYKKAPFHNSKFSKVTIGDKVASIGDYAFSGCGSITSITIPESVDSIGIYAFSGCSSITSITIPESVTSIVAYTFRDCSNLTSITIPESVTSIGNSAFFGCGSLASITIPENVKSVGNSAFFGCSSLASVTIPKNVSNIGEGAFSGCSSLVSTDIPESVTSIGTAAFSGCTGELVINCNIPSVPDYRTAPFYNSEFSKVTIGDKVTSIGDYAFSGCSSLTSIDISESVSSIGVGAFSDCNSLTSIAIPDSVTSIGASAFYCCFNLSSIIIPENSQLVRIGEAAFSGCSSLTSITIPEGVTSIGGSAFSYCSSLTSITCLALTPPYIFFESFYGVDYNSCKLFVPIGAVATYQSAYCWRNFLVIEEITSNSIQHGTIDEGQSSKIYDLNGRELSVPQSGIYIIGGRTVLVK